MKIIFQILAVANGVGVLAFLYLDHWRDCEMSGIAVLLAGGVLIAESIRRERELSRDGC